MERREFCKGVIYGFGAAVSCVAARGTGKELLEAKYPALRVEGGDRAYSNAMVKLDGDFLSGCLWGETGKGEAEVLVNTSKGALVVDHSQGELMTHILKGKVEIWALPGRWWPTDNERETFVRKVPDGPGYYSIYRYKPGSIDGAERLA